MEFEGIVIRRVPFKGDDMMISVLTKEKMRSFLAKGVMKIFSKNAFSCNFYTRSRFQTFKGKEGEFLRVGEVLESYPNIGNDMDKLALLDFVSEVTNTLLDRKDSSYVYEYMKKLLECFNKSFSPWTAALIYFTHVMTAAGYGMNVDECVECHKKTDISAISYYDGGFICKECYDQERHVKSSVRKLKIMRYIFKVDIENFEKVQFEKEECKEILFELANLLSWTSQIELKSLTLLKKIK